MSTGWGAQVMTSHEDTRVATVSVVFYLNCWNPEIEIFRVPDGKIGEDNGELG